MNLFSIFLSNIRANKGYTFLFFLVWIFVGLSVFKLKHDFLSGRKFSGSAFVVGAGEAESLPMEVIALKKIISLQGVKDFRLSDGLANHWHIFQRSIEFSYPARLDSKSSFIFADIWFRPETNCQLVNKLEDIILYECR